MKRDEDIKYIQVNIHQWSYYSACL